MKRAGVTVLVLILEVSSAAADGAITKKTLHQAVFEYARGIGLSETSVRFEPPIHVPTRERWGFSSESAESGGAMDYGVLRFWIGTWTSPAEIVEALLVLHSIALEPVDPPTRYRLVLCETDCERLPPGLRERITSERSYVSLAGVERELAPEAVADFLNAFLPEGEPIEVEYSQAVDRRFGYGGLFMKERSYTYPPPGATEGERMNHLKNWIESHGVRLRRNGDLLQVTVEEGGGSEWRP